MERKEIIDTLNGMCERCLIKGLIQSLDDARKLYDVFDRFRNNGYVRDDEYSNDILYFYNLATELHKSGNTSLEESYSIYSAILAADSVDFIETKESFDDNVKVKRNKK
jgi:metal-dependent HD superfamily phosphatase/phosphodiesterase